MRRVLFRCDMARQSRHDMFRVRMGMVGCGLSDYGSQGMLSSDGVRYGRFRSVQFWQLWCVCLGNAR